MSQPTGKILAMAGAGMVLASLFFHYFDGVARSFWELNSRWDVVVAATCVLIIVLAATTIGRVTFGSSIGLVMLSSFLCGAILFYAVEGWKNAGVGAWLGAAGGLFALAGAVSIARRDLAPQAAAGAPTGYVGGLPGGD